ncbi:diaminobutyrate--2-oxoglutarate transaminase [Streptomyces sp. NBC_00075]|uniref:diaminobutyrate--2-oxoglutarate transaminase n=1 Tax=Streptomyces sp. NBC_00075 TaxID=2975641 RepID=UPI00324F7095
MEHNEMNVFEDLESEVRSYCRAWPVVFDRAQGSWIYDEEGNAYLDFFAGAGALNYGHNHPALKAALVGYLERDGVSHTLDMFSVAKRDFLAGFQSTILKPRGLHYRVQFPGPAGANAVEAALKLARKATGRENIVSFTNAFHGVTLGALALAGNTGRRASAGTVIGGQIVMPFDGYLGSDDAGLHWLEATLAERGTGFTRPAAVIMETVQADGGVNVAGPEWLCSVSALCRAYDVLLIVDDIQVGCGRTGAFFSFEEAGIFPDIVTLSKSISGYGLPLALTLFSPELDVWSPGEHNGTFRGPNPAFVTATAALELWADGTLAAETTARGRVVEDFLKELRTAVGSVTDCRGRGLIWGIEFAEPWMAAEVCARAFTAGLLVESVGPADEVVKLSPPLTISVAELKKGLGILADAIGTLPAARAEKEGGVR